LIGSPLKAKKPKLSLASVFAFALATALLTPMGYISAISHNAS
jgi:hypothetical protein